MEDELPIGATPLPEPTPPAAPEPASVADPLAAALTAAEPPTYRDRSTGIAIFGVVQIILGCLAALMVPFAALGAFMSRLAPGAPKMRPSQFLSGIATYAFVAVVLVTLGIGSVQKKRWARALTLVTSWYWMIIGVLVTILLTAVLPVTMRDALRAQQTASGSPSELSTGVMAVIVTFMIVICAVFLVVVPVAFIIFFSPRDVAETFRRRDPVERWTDRAPLPVLGASVVLLVGAMYAALVGVTTPLFPFFGRYLTGFPAAACFLGFATLDTYLAIAVFRLQLSAWWITVLVAPVRLLSMAFTYGRADLMEAYSRLGWSDAQIKMLSSSPILRSHVILWWSLISLLVFFGYMLWLKRYFKAPAVFQ